MKQYHKINTIYKRDTRGNILIGEYSSPELEYLKDNDWVFTEKVDGTNVRVMWDGESLRFGGKTDNAQMPMLLVEKLQSLFTKEKMEAEFPNDPNGPLALCLYGEGYGAKIQKGGGNYNPLGVDFVLFDIRIGSWWLNRESVEDIGNRLGVKVVPTIGHGTLDDAVCMTRSGIYSQWGGFMAEGIVLRPGVELTARNGSRIITKIKHRDFGKDLK